MKKGLLAIFAALILCSSFKESVKPTKADPTTAPYFSALVMYLSGQTPPDVMDVWVRWTPDVVLSRDYYADVSVTYTDWCRSSPPWVKTIRVIIPKVTWTGWTNAPICQGGHLITYSLVGWGPL